MDRPSVAMFDPSTTTCRCSGASMSTRVDRPRGGCCTSSAAAYSAAMDDPTGEVTDLLQHLIRNECVNDGTDESGHEARSADRAADVPRGRRARPRARSRPRRAERTSSPASRAPTPRRRRLLLMGHTDVVPVNPDGWRHDPVRRRAHRRRGVGPRRGRHAQPHRVDGGRHQAPRRRRASARRARSSTSASPTRRRSARYGADHLVEHEARRRARRLRDHRVGRHPDPEPDAGCKLPVIVGEKGSHWCTLRVTGTPGPRLAALQDRQRAGQGGRGRAPPRRVRARDADPRHLAPVPRGHGLPRASSSAPLLDPDRLRGAAATTLPLGHGPPVPRVHPHDVRADDRPRRHEDQRHPRPRRPRDRHPHAAGPGRAPRCAPCSTRPSATSPARCELIASNDDPSTASPIDTPLWDALGRVTAGVLRGRERSSRS